MASDERTEIELRGSFGAPVSSAFANAPGAVLFGEGEISLNEGREAFAIELTNTGDRAVQIGSHYHFFEVNPALRFYRRAAFGRRLDIPSGTSVRFEAGQTHTVALVPYGGAGRIAGFRGITNGKGIEAAAAEARKQGIDVGEGEAL